ncbi:helix-turn-helix domain-containing protein [Mesorhizobium sp. M2A.F.Ca.ET.037.01.1.1]|uniref:helix-turn-helix domain-containing protein n=1 Tax=unclassified Mesorhizobium TaxID=325217 RepID=UPI000F764E05|nr:MULTISPECIES: AraC family transcriptional regulator [unclassified Mesorhizobium]RUY05752.1 helix-turn-helix domain-containing protein [Mesorhizobium sp. M2A.F.Ca.ET.040.01.1.1]RVC74781.1 helix-turn-helix domain-containing protein [Mesorhizobium sp. M2A.F.Ca.ET.046.02.1.1]AZO38293.1 AraC family transcriptional regulator [Mesorhizobium sp. M2A.F.Ca.ET.046.03.2.1]RUX02428.1 helix-turn-helix domain-containing protein [Mesorhizobium sp. M2A.F.Ca.ET.037.01.1.1]RWA90595.1 MAG: helix-turn-helix dom
MNAEIARSVGRFVGLEEPRTLSTRFLQVAEIIGTRVNWTQVDQGTPVHMESSNGYLLCLQRRYLPSYPYWVNGKPVSSMPLHGGQFLFLDLNEDHASVTKGTVDCLSMYTSGEALQRFQDEHDLRPVGKLRTANGVALSDPTISNLGECLVPAFERPDTMARLFADQLATALMTHLTAFYSEQPAALRPVRGGLARRHERRAKEMLLANMDGQVGLEELARVCGLSRSHFARAFKATVGLSPFQWLVAQRVEQAKSMLLNSDLPVGEIGHACGFSDQSHFTRIFVKYTGIAPAAWRRVRRS